MVACANNHAGDYGEQGVIANIDNLDAHGMTHAGTGRTPGRGRGAGLPRNA